MRMCGEGVPCCASPLRCVGTDCHGFPLFDIASFRLNHWRHWSQAWMLARLGIATFVDNLFAIAYTPESATRILDGPLPPFQMGVENQRRPTCSGYAARLCQTNRTTSQTVTANYHEGLGPSPRSRWCNRVSRWTCCHCNDKGFHRNLKWALLKSSQQVKLRFLPHVFVKLTAPDCPDVHTPSHLQVDWVGFVIRFCMHFLR